MLKLYKTTVFLVLSVLALGVIHSGTVTASNLGHIESNSSTQNNNVCKPICHGFPVASKTRIINIKKDDREPNPPRSTLNERSPIVSDGSILADRQIWKLASWTPPDRLLIASAYSTSL